MGKEQRLTRKIMKKIQVLIIFALAIGFFGLLFYWRQENRKEAESLDGLQKIYNEYDKKIRVIRNDMEKRKSEADDVEKPGNVIFAFSGSVEKCGNIRRT